MKKKRTFLAVGLAALLGLGLAKPMLSAYSEPASRDTFAVTDSNRSALLGVDDPDAYYLGVASLFSVFLRGDFDAEGSDCEGRLAAGGNANIGTMANYSVGARLEEEFSAAQVVIGGDTLTNFQPNGKKFVVGEVGTVDDVILEYHNIGLCELYEGELIDFDKEFALLNERSRTLAESEENAELTVNPYYRSGWTVTGTDPNLNVLNLDAEAFDTFNGGYLELKVYMPEGAYLVINVPGEHVDMPVTNVVVYDNEGNITHKTGENMPILYNLPDAEDFFYTGSIQGSTLAPNADAGGEEGGHVAGATIANSFAGGIQFGYSAFNPTRLEELPVETTTTTTTTTTPETTTTTTTTTPETTTTTTTTTPETTTTTTTSTTTTTTTTTTTATTTTATTTTTMDAMSETTTTSLEPRIEITTTTETTTTTTETTTTSTTAAATTAATTTTAPKKSGSPNTGESKAIPAACAAAAGALLLMAVTLKKRR